MFIPVFGAVELTLKPQDGQADTVLNLNLAPTFVTYKKLTLEKVTEFFKTEKVREILASSEKRRLEGSGDCDRLSLAPQAWQRYSLLQ